MKALPAGWCFFVLQAAPGKKIPDELLPEP
jgi:hypothetical protein